MARLAQISRSVAVRPLTARLTACGSRGLKCSCWTFLSRGTVKMAHQAPVMMKAICMAVCRVMLRAS